jgi:hypothetical protein
MPETMRWRNVELHGAHQPGQALKVAWRGPFGPGIVEGCQGDFLADCIASLRDWHFGGLEMGINVRNLSVKEFVKRVERFIGTAGAL